MVEKSEALLVALMGVSWKCETKTSATRRNPVRVGNFPRWRTFPLHFFHRLVVIDRPWSADSLFPTVFETAKVTHRWVDPTRSAENASWWEGERWTGLVKDFCHEKFVFSWQV